MEILGALSRREGEEATPMQESKKGEAPSAGNLDVLWLGDQGSAGQQCEALEAKLTSNTNLSVAFHL